MAVTMDGMSKIVPSTITFMSMEKLCDSPKAMIEGALTSSSVMDSSMSMDSPYSKIC